MEVHKPKMFSDNGDVMELDNFLWLKEGISRLLNGASQVHGKDLCVY